MSARLDALTDRQFRYLDAGTKLAGVGIMAIGLAVGIETAPGLALVLAGVLLGVSTAFHTEDTQ